MSFILLSSISKTFNRETDNPFQALSDVHFDVEKGDCVSIMGPSGSGKSTLMNIIGMLDIPDSGSYRLDEHDITKMRKSELPYFRRNQIGFVFQTFNLLPRMTVAQNISMPMMYNQVPRDERKQRIEALLETVKLSKRKDYYPTKLSGGERQRVAIARALVNNPSIILADEPTGNLDSKSGQEIISALLELNRAEGRTLIIVTHDPSIAEQTDRRFEMIDGRLKELSQKT
ncbi:MAG: ABC transporter ATP-binding protein [bacterium]|nr:ABC transporter ATP-binding protein [bacterium]